MAEKDVNLLGTISINVYDGSLNHETTMSTADTVFWLETVKILLLQEVMGEESNES